MAHGRRQKADKGKGKKDKEKSTSKGILGLFRRKRTNEQEQSSQAGPFSSLPAERRVRRDLSISTDSRIGGGHPSATHTPMEVSPLSSSPSEIVYEDRGSRRRGSDGPAQVAPSPARPVAVRKGTFKNSLRGIFTRSSKRGHDENQPSTSGPVRASPPQARVARDTATTRRSPPRRPERATPERESSEMPNFDSNVDPALSKRNEDELFLYGPGVQHPESSSQARVSDDKERAAHIRGKDLLITPLPMSLTPARNNLKNLNPTARHGSIRVVKMTSGEGPSGQNML